MCENRIAKDRIRAKIKEIKEMINTMWDTDIRVAMDSGNFISCMEAFKWHYCKLAQIEVLENLLAADKLVTPNEAHKKKAV